MYIYDGCTKDELLFLIKSKRVEIQELESEIKNLERREKEKEILEIRKSKQMTLRDLIFALEVCEDKTSKKVYIEVDGVLTWFDGFDSYRGDYSELSIGYKENSLDVTSVERLLYYAKSCLDRSFSGYKGGEYYMDNDSFIWISKYDTSSQIALNEAVYKNDRLILKGVKVK